MPKYPLHYNCHCWLMPTDNIQFKATCEMGKFESYAFKLREKDDKSGLFSGWGYDKIDAKNLINEYCRQAQEKYSKGEFTLFELKDYGQIININITLNKKNSLETITIKSGWMVYPDGEIKLTTVFAGFIE
ncbi:MAG: hypothetical protein NC332_02470 [Firmicutes bacterium]|nr:hypothetical protein [Bacillota bacterium]